MLPVNEKVNRVTTNALRVYVYGQPNVGKTTFANGFPDTLMLNTDGNIKYIDSPVIQITSWEEFIGALNDILTVKHSYKTIVVDLVEDIYQYCRTYYNKKANIDHEADVGFGKAYDIVRNNFLIAIRKLSNSGLNIILISHEEANTVKDKVGRETTTFQPAINDKMMTKLSGIMDLTGRIMIKSDIDAEGKVTEERILYVNSTKDQFGGNKIHITADYITLGYKNLINVMESTPVAKQNIEPVIKREVDKGILSEEEVTTMFAPAKEEEITLPKAEPKKVGESIKIVKKEK